MFQTTFSTHQSQVPVIKKQGQAPLLLVHQLRSGSLGAEGQDALARSPSRVFRISGAEARWVAAWLPVAHAKVELAPARSSCTGSGKPQSATSSLSQSAGRVRRLSVLRLNPRATGKRLAKGSGTAGGGRSLKAPAGTPQTPHPLERLTAPTILARRVGLLRTGEVAAAT